MRPVNKAKTYISVFFAFIFLFGSISMLIPENVSANPPPVPAVVGPITENTTSHAFDPAANTNFTTYGYVQEEYFISGTANVYENTTTTGFGIQVRTAAVPYTTRILIRRPATPAGWSGNVIFEMINPSGSYDLGTGWIFEWKHIVNNKDIWVGMTCREVILDSGVPLHTGLKKFDPIRYGGLTFSGHQRELAYEIFAQIGNLLKSNHPTSPLKANGFTVQKVIGHGYSQTGGMLITYINFFAPVFDNATYKIFDGYNPCAAGGPTWMNDDDIASMMGFGGNPETDWRRIIQPCSVPVIHVLTETEINTATPFLGALPTRRLDSDNATDKFRRYEIPGGAHMGQKSSLWGAASADVLKAMGYACPYCCVEPYANYSDFPQYYIFDGVLNNLERWIAGTAAPTGNTITTVGNVISRDTYGNALGGLRSAWVDVPFKKYFPGSTGCPTCTPAQLCAACNIWCFLMGTATPFDQARLCTLYNDAATYLSRFNASVDAMLRGGWVTAADAQSIKIDAQSYGVLNGVTCTQPTPPAPTITFQHTGGSGGAVGTNAPAPVTPPVPLANVVVQSASLSASKVGPGSPVTVTANIANNSAVNGSARIKLFVNGQEESSQALTVESGHNIPIVFTVSRNDPGTYDIYVGGIQAGKFTVDMFADNEILIYSIIALFTLAIIGILFLIVRRRAA